MQKLAVTLMGRLPMTAAKSGEFFGTSEHVLPPL